MATSAWTAKQIAPSSSSIGGKDMGGSDAPLGSSDFMLAPGKMGLELGLLDGQELQERNS